MKGEIYLKNEHEYDRYCKLVLSQKWVIARLLKHCIKEYEDCSYEEIIELIEDPMIDETDDLDFIESKNTEDNGKHGMIRFDVLLYARLPKSKDVVGMIINLEAQGYRPEYPILKRGIYYLSRLISRQKGKSPGFMKSDYGKLKKVVGIWIYHQGPEKQGMVNLYEISENIKGKRVQLKKTDYDLMSLVLVSPNEETEGKDEMMDILSLLFTSRGKPTGDTLLRLKNEYGIVLMKEESEEIEKMCNWSEVRLEQGRIEGKAAGKAEGREERELEVALNLLKEDVSIKVIEKSTGISLKKLLEMKQELESQKISMIS